MTLRVPLPESRGESLILQSDLGEATALTTAKTSNFSMRPLGTSGMLPLAGGTSAVIV